MDYIEKLIEDVRSEKNSIYLYGAGYLADKYRQLLDENEVEIAGYIVDSEYLSKSEKEIKGKPVVGIESIADDITLIVAVRASGLRVKLPESPFIRKVIALDYSTYVNFGALDEDFLVEHKDEIADIFSRLADFESKRSLLNFIDQKLTGTYNKQYTLKPQYFDDDVFLPAEDEVFVDCGAYTGDSVTGFAEFLKQNKISSFRRCIAFEPDSENYETLCENVKGYANVETYKLGVHSEKATLCFSAGNQKISSITESGETRIDVDSIDNIVGDDMVTYIKMDIEGSEMSALKGAEKTILRNKPRLAVCIYHRTDDFIKIPQYILSLVPEYKLYVRNYDPTGVDTVLYAIKG